MVRFGWRIRQVALVMFLLPVLVSSQTNTKAAPGQNSKQASPALEKQKAAIAELENKWLDALTNADVNAIAEVLADDFVRPAPDYGNFVGKTDLLAFYRSHLSKSSNEKRIEDLKVTIYGSTALARGTLTTINPQGAPIAKLLFTDVFVQRNGRWQAVSAQENAVTMPSPATH